MAEEPILDPDRARAKAELETMEEPEFRPKRRWKWIGAGVAAVIVIVGGYLLYSSIRERRDEARLRKWQEEERKAGGTGCPCGCDRSATMAADLVIEGGDDAARAIEKTLVTIAEREAVGYVTERMIQHRLRMLAVAKELERTDIVHGATSAARCRREPTEGDGLRVCTDIVLHGERFERVNGEPKKIGSSFRVWLEIENVGETDRTLETPSLEAGAFVLPVSRWYLEGGAGERWDGVVRARTKVRVNVIGDAATPVAPGTALDVTLTLEGLRLPLHAEALADIHLLSSR